MGACKIVVEEKRRDETHPQDVCESTMRLPSVQGYQVDPRSKFKRPSTAHSVVGLSQPAERAPSRPEMRKSPEQTAAARADRYQAEAQDQNEGSDEEPEATYEKNEPEEENKELAPEEEEKQQTETVERLLEPNPETEQEDPKEVATLSPGFAAIPAEEKKQVAIDVGRLSQRSIIVDKQPIRTCCFSPEGELLAIGTNSMTLKICSLKDIITSLDEKYQCQLQGPIDMPVVLEQKKYHNGSIYSVDWSHTGRLIATGSNDKTINLLISPFSDASNTNKVGVIMRLS